MPRVTKQLRTDDDDFIAVIGFAVVALLDGGP